MKNKAIQPWEAQSREVVFKKYNRVVEKVMFKLPNGDISDYYIKKEGPAAAILALTQDQKIILFRQFRPGPNKVLMELPGGFIEPNEDPLTGASRELLEETGYTGKLEFVTNCLDDAYSTMDRGCFVAKDCVKIQEPSEDPTELGEVVLSSIPEFRNHLKSGRMTDVEVGYLCLDHLGLLTD